MPFGATSPVVPAALALLIAFFVDKFVTLRRIVARLKSEHRGLWVSLGCPEAFTSLLSSRGDFYMKASNRTSLTLWLSRGDYRELNDPIITKLAGHMKFIRRGAVVVVVALMSALMWVNRND
jgi:hypothetical protein